MLPGSPKRARRVRRRRLRRTGRTLQWLAVVPVLLAVLVLINAAQDDDSPRVTSGQPGVTTTTGTTIATAVVPDSTPSAGDLTDLADDAGIDTSSGIPVAGVNHAPVVNAPPDGSFILEERVTVIGLSIDDVEAEANGGVIGVLLTVPTAGIYMDVPPGVQAFGEQGWGWFPMVGNLEGINAALATLQLEPLGQPRRLNLSILASDFGHGDPDAQEADAGVVVYFRT